MPTLVRALHVINSGEPGGGSEHLHYLLDGLTHHGMQGTVVVGRDGLGAERLRSAGYPVQVIGPMGVHSPPRILRILRAVHPDLLHLHGSRAGFLGILAARVARTRPIVYTAHAFSFKRRLPAPLRWLAAQADRVTCHAADRVICLTAADARTAAARGILGRPAAVIPNGIPGTRFVVDTTRRAEFGFPADAAVVGMVARLVPDKDPVQFVTIAARVSCAAPAARFLLVGDGPLRPEVEQAVRAAGLQDRFVIAGFRGDIPELLATMDVAVLTSRWEAMPMAVLEAMAAGRPVVAPALPGLAEVLVDGETGYLVPGLEPDLAAAITGLIRDPARRQAMGERGRRRVREQFDVARMVDATARVYQEVLARGKRTGVGTMTHSPGA